MDPLGALVKLDLPVGRMLTGAVRSGGLRRPEHGAALDCRGAGLLDGAQPGGDPRLAGGDGLPVASAVRAFGQVGAILFASRMWASRSPACAASANMTTLAVV